MGPICRNISDSTGNPPGTAKLKHVFKKDGVRIGVFGLAEKDWIGENAHDVWHFLISHCVFRSPWPSPVF